MVNISGLINHLRSIGFGSSANAVASLQSENDRLRRSLNWALGSIRSIEDWPDDAKGAIREHQEALRLLK